MAARLGDRYRLLHPVWGDRLGMTHIGRAPDGTPAAVRVLAPELAADPAVLRRAKTTRDLLTAIRHPNLARVRDVLVEDGVAIAADAILGRTLRHARLTAEELQRVSRGIAAGLRALHEHGVWHRTLSPATVMINRTGEVVLTDIAVGHVADLPGSVAADQQALVEALSSVWRNTHRIRRPPRDMWADTMARARDMG